MEELIASFLDSYGWLAVFVLLMASGVGLPIGEDIITIPAGALIGGGHLAFWPTLIAAYAGVIAADYLWFWVCSMWGTPLLHTRFFKRLIHPRRLLEVKHQFEKRGTWLVIMARFIPTSRTTTITVAGMMHMPFWKFALATAGCVLITAPLQIGLGVLIGKGIGSESMAELLLKMIGLFMLFFACIIALRWWRAYRETHRRPERARASWLRRFRVRRKGVGNGNGGSGANDRAAGTVGPHAAQAGSGPVADGPHSPGQAKDADAPEAPIQSDSEKQPVG